VTRTGIVTKSAPRPSGAYSQGIRSGSIVAVAGQVGIDPVTGLLADGLAAQTRQAMKNIDAILRAASASLDSVVQVRCYLRDVGRFDEFNAAYSVLMPDPKPARVAIGVAIPGDGDIEIEVLAVVDGV
jgi:reactive intermediate/imine deaminase